MEKGQVQAVMQAAGFTVSEAANPRLVQAVRLFMRATSVEDMDMLANDILELRRGREHVRSTD